MEEWAALLRRVEAGGYRAGGAAIRPLARIPLQPLAITLSLGCKIVGSAQSKVSRLSWPSA